MTVNNEQLETTTSSNSGLNEETGASNNSQEKMFTQSEVNDIIAKQKSKIVQKVTSKYEELGTPEELAQLKAEAEKRRQEEQLKRGEFEKTLQELAQKKDAEIEKWKSKVHSYQISTPLMDAAAQARAVNPGQVRDLLANKVKLNDDGEIDIVDNGQVKYKDDGTKYGVQDLVQEFLSSNPHFVQPTKSTTNTESNVDSITKADIDFSKLNMKDPKVRQKYAKYRKERGLAN